MLFIAFLLLAVASLPAQRPRYGGTLVMETSATFQQAIPAAMPPRIAALVFEPPLALGATGFPKPALLNWWTSDKTGRRWKARIADRVVTHDGEPLTAQAIVTALAPLIALRVVASPSGELAFQSAESRPWAMHELSLPRVAVFPTGPFRIAAFEPGRRLLLAAHDVHRDGRPYLDAIEILLARSHADQLRDLELGRADVIELQPADARRQQQRGRRVWSSPPQQLIALVWDPARPAARNAVLREALALAIDRQPMLNVLLQRQGEITGALLPQRLTGYAFLFPTARDLARATSLMAGSAPAVTLYSDPADAPLRPLADRIALNARDAGIALRVVTAPPSDLVLRRLPIHTEPAIALEELARSLGLSLSIDGITPEALLQAERQLLDGHSIVPLFHVPVLLGLSPRVRDTSTPRSLRWPAEDAWLEAR